MQKTELSDGVQKTASSFSLINPDVSSLEGELVNKKKEDKAKLRQGTARKRSSGEYACWGFHSEEFGGNIQILILGRGTTAPFKTKNNF